jgi:Nif-specific regulatory protein
VRELENVIERAMVLSGSNQIGQEDLPLQIASGPRRDSFSGKGFHEAVREFKRWIIYDALKQSQSNQTRAAELLGLQRTYLAKLLRLLEIKQELRSSDSDKEGS